ncbi:MAG: NAD(P)/FAD-dependent oxidoreductase [Bacilli bacterium]|jgi:thioredoxin reductase (NADPH)
MYKVIIIGAGPIGLYLAGRLEEAGISYLLLEASTKIGGQLTSLYPEKEIVDIPEIKSILAKDYIALLAKKISPANVKFEQDVLDIKSFDNHAEIITQKSYYSAEYIIIATGLGFYRPKTMGLPHEEEFSNILYSIKDFAFLKDKRVAIFGGGDSALDWAKEISRFASKLYLIHRRREFRGNIETIKDIDNINILTPFVPLRLLIEGTILTGVSIKSVEDETTIDIEADYILVNFGNVPSPVTFNVPKQNTGIICDEHHCVLNRVYVAGDAIGTPGKIKRISHGLRDADSVLHLILKL